MSVYHQTMVVYGWDIGTEAYKKFDEERFGWHYRDVGDVVCVYDGRCGDYCYLGVVVAASNSTRDGPQFIEPTNVMAALTTQQKAELAGTKEQMGIESASGHPTFHVFTHVT